MIVYRCDKCGAEMATNKLTGVRLNGTTNDEPNPDHVGYGCDICLACVEVFKAWFWDRPKRPEQK